MHPKSLRPFFSFYGGKWRDSKRLYPVPKKGTIIEPFAGSAGYSVRYPDRSVILYDKDPNIVSVWDFLIRASSREIMSLPDVPLDGFVSDLNLIPEAAALIGYWVNRASAAPCNKPSAWMRTGKWPGSFWGTRVKTTIASQVEHIRHWKIFHREYCEIPIARKCTWFVDPPYQTQGKHYVHGSKGIDYKHLADWCRQLTGQTIVCEAHDATWLPFNPIGVTKTTRRDKPSKESIWINEST